MSESIETPAILQDGQATDTKPGLRWLGWSSLLFAFIQSVCTAFVALSGIRLLFGAASFAAAAGLLQFVDVKLHVTAIRVPMIVLGLGGALFNLIAVWQVRRLRKRSASAWRQKAISTQKLHSERFQVAISVATLVLLALEEYYHHKLWHGL